MNVHEGVVEPQLLFVSDEALSQQTCQHAKCVNME